MRTVTCTNNEGYTTTFTETAFTPFLLAHIDGLYETVNDVTISENKVTDGGTWVGSVKKTRNITLTLSDTAQNKFRQRHRDLLYSLFKKGTEGTLTYNEDGDKREIKYRVEYVRDNAFNKRLYTVSLLCPDPYFYATERQKIEIASYVSSFEFPHQFRAEGEEFGYRSIETIATFNNELGVDGVGITIQIDVLGAATNPSIIHVETNDKLEIGYETKPLELQRGDRLLITTETNNKHVYLIRGGVQTEINEYLTEDSVFIQLIKGTNNIGYDADVAPGNLIVTISYRMKYEGA